MTREEFKNIFDSHFEGVRNYIYYRSGDKDLATDVAQETSNIKALLYKIAGDILITNLRKHKVVKNYKARIISEELSESPADILHYKELVKNYENALESLPEKQRTVFLLSRMDGLKYYEIADNVGISIKAVEKRMKNALEYLRKAITN